MYFSLATVMAVAPVLAAALPKEAHTGHPHAVTIPISKHASSPIKRDGTVDIDALRAHIAHTKGKFNHRAANASKRSLTTPEAVRGGGGSPHGHHPNSPGSGTCRNPVGTNENPYKRHVGPVEASTKAEPGETSTAQPSPAVHPVPNDPGSHPPHRPLGGDTNSDCNTMTMNPSLTIRPSPSHPSHSQQPSQGNFSATTTSQVQRPTVTSSVPSSGGNPASGKEALTRVGGAWIGKVSVGTPPVEFTVDFDTGSADFFIPAAGCTGQCTDLTQYDPDASSTSTDLGQQVYGQFGDGSIIVADAFSDVVSISGLSASKQVLGAASNYLGYSLSADGIMGLSFPSLSTIDSPNPIQSLADQGLIEDAVFSFKLTSDASELSIGSPNTALFTGDITYTPVIDKSFWVVTTDAIGVNGQVVLQSITGIVDTGTTLMYGTQQEVAQIYQAIPGARDGTDSIGEGGFIIPCDNLATVSMTFGGKTFDIDPQLLNAGQLDNQGQNCLGSIIGADIPGIGWVFGDLLLQNVYTVFDMDKAQVGFANLA